MSTREPNHTPAIMPFDPPANLTYLLPLFIAAVAGYLIGSVPFGMILTRLAGAGDLRRIGSGNIGATNVLRTGRKGLALATLLLDLAKGAVPTALGYRLFGPDIAVVLGATTALGHCFPIYLWFRGGKAVATAAGVVLALTPLIFLVVLGVFALVIALSRYVSLASISAALSAAIGAYAFSYYQVAELYSFLAVLILIKHGSNIRRLIAGNENRLSFARK